MPKKRTNPDCFDETHQISIRDLWERGYLNKYSAVRGNFGWTRGGRHSGSITIQANFPEKYIELDYCIGDRSVCYKVELVSLPKHFGGCEWYFVCPQTGKRCKTLYRFRDRFFSRYAYPSAMYSLQAETKRFRAVLGGYRSMQRLEKFLKSRYAKTMYAGKLTKRFQRLLRNESQIDHHAIRDYFRGCRP